MSAADNQARIDAAVEAYLAGDTISSIVSRFSLHDRYLYAALDRRKIPRRGPRRKVRERWWCEWCGDELTGDQERFCCVPCSQDFASEGIDMSCVICGERVKHVSDECCSGECRDILAQRRTAESLRVVRRYSGYLPVDEIAAIAGCGYKQVTAYQAMLRDNKAPDVTPEAKAEACGIGRLKIYTAIDALGISRRGRKHANKFQQRGQIG